MPEELPSIENQPTNDVQTRDVAAKSSDNKPVELLVWDAPARLFDPKSPQWFLGLMALGLIAIIIFAILREVWLILLTAAIVFVYYALARVEPAEVEHRVISSGVEIGGRLYSWEDLKSFSISPADKIDLLKFETKLIFPHSLELLLPEETSQEEMAELKSLLQQYLPYEAKPHSEVGAMADHAILSLSDKLPFRNKMLGWVERRVSTNEPAS